MGLGAKPQLKKSRPAFRVKINEVDATTTKKVVGFGLKAQELKSVVFDKVYYRLN